MKTWTKPELKELSVENTMLSLAGDGSDGFSLQTTVALNGVPQGNVTTQGLHGKPPSGAVTLPAPNTTQYGDVTVTQQVVPKVP